MTVTALADAMRRLADSPETRQILGEAGWNYARELTWEKRVAEMNEWYEECMRGLSCRQKLLPVKNEKAGLRRPASGDFF
jgi:hypothetical protein